MEAAVEVVCAPPLERVLNRTPEPNVDVPVLHIKEDGLLLVRAVYTGKVFTVKLRHHRDDQACSDNVRIKDLDKHNMPRLGDVMVPPPQIIQGFLGQVAANEPLYRFQTKRSGRSSRSKLKR